MYVVKVTSKLFDPMTLGDVFALLLPDGAGVVFSENPESARPCPSIGEALDSLDAIRAALPEHRRDDLALVVARLEP